MQTSASIGDPPELREVVERIVAAPSPIEVVLFGFAGTTGCVTRL